ncbi:MAG: hypothetical protein COV46_00935 [Deltaproteobacteria bacterium CG11_big_fil_rev_8_21_14_0_20_49_13]|nr:MAG: hypothetical protein COV46_00935 [Deltaproteobacteria bacterium CG11_big_fil_rev_8_21_14_0_20_49_13]
MSKCVFCQKEIEIIDRVGVRDGCDSCGNPLHCCLQCKFFDRGAFHECKERVEYRVEEKDRPNYCDMFSFGRDAVEKVADKNDIKSKLDALFKK